MTMIQLLATIAALCGTMDTNPACYAKLMACLDVKPMAQAQDLIPAPFDPLLPIRGDEMLYRCVRKSVNQ